MQSGLSVETPEGVTDVEPPLLVMLVGMPGSGKTTTAVRLAGAIRSRGRVCRIVGTDAYLEAEAARRGLSYAAIFAQEFRNAEAFMWMQAKEAIARRISVVWDQTNLTVKARHQRLRLFPRDYLCIAAVMATAEDEARRRNAARGPGRAVPACVYDRMLAELHLPNADEGFQMFI